MLVKTWLEKEKLNEMMLDELDRLKRKGYKKIKGKWLDEHRRRMFDATGLLDFPSDWDSLTEDEKETRLNKVIKITKETV